MLEIEVKLPIPSLPAAQQKLEALGWAPAERLFERNTVYDAAGSPLAKAGKLLRIRETGERAILTVKVPAGGQGIHKIREEHNLDGPVATLEGIVAGLGFEAAWRYEKYRTRYRRGGEPGVVEMDETPVGNYLELEGPPEWIDQTAAALGFSPADYNTSTYRDLFVEWQGKQAAPPRDMVFA